MTLETQETAPDTAGDFDFWLAMNAARTAAEKPKFHDGKPECGYYRTRRCKDGPMLPTVIVRNEETGKLEAFRGFAPDIPHIAEFQHYAPVEIKHVWPWAAEEAVSWDDFDVAYRTGIWPTDAPPMGHNVQLEGHAGLKAALADQVGEALAWLKKLGPITRKEDADKAANWQKRIDEIRLKADKEFRDEKDPLNAAATKCDEKWAFRKQAVAAAQTLKKAWEAYLQKVEDEKQAALKKELETKTVDQIAPAEKVTVGGTGRGGGKSLRTVPTYVVKDYDKAIEYLRGTQGFRDLVDEHVKKLHGAGVEVPGCMIENRRVA